MTRLRFAYLGGGCFLVLLGLGASWAQLFNLEDEDRQPAPSAPAVDSLSKIPYRDRPREAVSAGLLPAGSPAAEETFEKLYSEIVGALKAGDVPLAQKIISNRDVITKQKVIHRLLQEDPKDFERGPGPASESASDAALSPALTTKEDGETLQPLPDGTEP